MALSEETYDKIQRYLDGELTTEERGAFEQEMETNQEFAQEVALHANMEELLADSPENELRRNLKMLGEEVKDEPPATGGSLLSKWFWLLVPLMLFAAWWLLQPPLEEPPSAIDVREEPFGEDVQSNQREGDFLPGETPPEETPPKNETPTENRAPETKKEESNTTSRPIATNFNPNPSLEFLMDNNLRSDEFEWTETELQQNVTGTANQPFRFRFTGTLETAADLSKQEFKLHLFSNDPAAFDNFEPLSTNDLMVQKKGEDAYLIDFHKSMTLAPGLYYYLIEDFTEEQIYFVEKFEVR